MSHFKYEIDERNLRLQLKANEVPFNEDAWQKFENFSAAQKSAGGDHAMKRVQLSLNRNVVLPMVFGSVIILFSLLLFNFINIKNPNTTPAAATVVQASVSPIATKPETPPARVQAAPAEVKDTVAVAPNPAIEAAKPVEVIEKPAQPAATLPGPKAATPVMAAAKPVEAPKAENVVTNTNTPAKQATARKISKKRTLIATEPSAEEDEQAPPPADDAAAQN